MFFIEYSWCLIVYLINISFYSAEFKNSYTSWLSKNASDKKYFFTEY